MPAGVIDRHRRLVRVRRKAPPPPPRSARCCGRRTQGRCHRAEHPRVGSATSRRLTDDSCGSTTGQAVGHFGGQRVAALAFSATTGRRPQTLDVVTVGRGERAVAGLGGPSSLTPSATAAEWTDHGGRGQSAPGEPADASSGRAVGAICPTANVVLPGGSRAGDDVHNRLYRGRQRRHAGTVRPSRETVVATTSAARTLSGCDDQRSTSSSATFGTVTANCHHVRRRRPPRRHGRRHAVRRARRASRRPRSAATTPLQCTSIAEHEPPQRLSRRGDVGVRRVRWPAFPGSQIPLLILRHVLVDHPGRRDRLRRAATAVASAADRAALAGADLRGVNLAGVSFSCSVSRSTCPAPTSTGRPSPERT